jgi:radical SAM-linked protein
MEEVSALRVRIKFSKTGAMKYIGHLDVMRYFQKALRRADIRVALSGGFSPHMLMSFAAPLGVGLTSEAEYFDLDLAEDYQGDVLVQKLNEQMADGFRVLDAREISTEKGQKGMTLVAAADYEIRVRDLAFEALIAALNGLAVDDAIALFLNQEEIPVEKKTKKGMKEMNIRPLIGRFVYADGTFSMTVSQGSRDNLRPELVLSAFAKRFGAELSRGDLRICRKEIYARQGEGEQEKLVPLNLVSEQ